jgi:hypothetical protein
MPDRKMFDLCSKITQERDPEKLTATIDELIKLLNEEQAAIKAKIRANLNTGMPVPE